MEEWKGYKLGDVLTIKYGKDHKQLADGNIPIYGSGGIMRYGERSLYDGPSILIPRKGSLNNIMYTDKPFWTVDTMFWTIIDEEVANPLFVYYSICKKDFASLNVGSAVPSLTVPVIEDVDILLPSKFTQDKIVSILKSLDDKIEVNRRINDNLERQAQALFKSWFIDFEPFRDKPFVESELGMIPEGWEVVSLGEIIEENIKSKIQVKQARDVKGDYPFFTSGTTVLEYDEFLVSGRNIFLNTGGVAGVNFYIGNAAYSTDTWCIKCKDNLTDFLYLYLVSVLDIINTQYFEGSALKHLKKRALKERLIAIPSKHIIKDFVKGVMPLFDKIMSNKKQNRILSQIRDTLLPRLMSGELEVKDIEDCL